MQELTGQTEELCELCLHGGWKSYVGMKDVFQNDVNICKQCKHINITGFKMFTTERGVYEMAETPLAIRVSDDVKALFNELAEAGDFENKGEFLNRLIAQYQLEAAKKGVSIMKPAIEVVETLTGRLLEVLNGTAAAILTNEEKHMQELNDTRESLQERILELEHGRNEDAGRIQALIGDIDAAKAKQGELLDNIKLLESALNDKDALLKEYQDKSDTQNKLDSLLHLLEEQREAIWRAENRGTPMTKDIRKS